MSTSTYDLYLNLLQEALLGTIYRDPPLDPWSGIVTNEAGLIIEFGKVAGVAYIEPGAYDEKKRDGGKDWPMTAHTMIGRRRLEQLREACEAVLNERVAGDFIETGVWRGGACIFMAGILRAYGISPRRVFVADSFEGLPVPNGEKYPVDKNDYHHIAAPLLAVSLEQVRENFKRYDLLDENIVFMKGWFKDTLPTAPIEKLAVLRLDGDMYESTWDALAALYDKVSPGGFIIVDDYNSVRGCHEAIETFRKERGITTPMSRIDESAVYWRK